MSRKKELTRGEVMNKLFFGVRDIEIILDCSHTKAQKVKNEIEKIILEDGKELFNRKVPKSHFILYVKEKYGCKI